MLIRVGLPVPGGGLLRAAKAIGCPLLVSAGAFIRWPREDRYRGVPFPGFKKPSPDLAGTDIALDSAGFVAMVLHRGYEWSVAQYVELAAAHPWAWWSQMDLCCVPEIAHDRGTVRLRQAETARLYWECAREAERVQIPPPMPIVQGWAPDDYAWAYERAPARATLIGVGSVCRRQLGGPDGLEAVISRLDRVLEPDVQMHLFGVKSEAVSILAQHDRIASVDSMAWDAAARWDNRGSNTVAKRAEAMTSWYARQLQRAAGKGRALQAILDLLPPEHAGQIPEELLELLAAGEIELQTISPNFLAEWIYDDL